MHNKIKTTFICTFESHALVSSISQSVLNGVIKFLMNQHHFTQNQNIR